MIPGSLMVENSDGATTRREGKCGLVIPPEIEGWATVALDCAFAIHREFGPGLLESAYEAAFAEELRVRGVPYSRQTAVPLVYRGRPLEVGFRADLLIADSLLIELKAGDLLPVHQAQVITYLKILNLPLGLLINFNVELLKHGIRRVLNLRFQH